MHPSMQRTWEADDVETDLRAALDLVVKLDPPDDLRAATFQFATQLLTQRAMRQTVGSVQLPAMPQG